MVVTLRRWYVMFFLWAHACFQYVSAVLTTVSAVFCITSLVLLGLAFAFQLDPANVVVYTRIQWVLLCFFACDSALNVLVFHRSRWHFMVLKPADTVAILAVTAHWFYPGIEISYSTSQLILLAIVIGRWGHMRQLLTWLKIRPAQIIILTFLFVIFSGALVLSLPLSSQSGQSISFVDALFTACSAVCVTGLTVNTIATDFTLFAQGILLVLIQIGGLGIMSFSVLLMLIFKRKLSQSDTLRLQESYATVTLTETASTIRFIFKFTLFFECIGAVALFLCWSGNGLSVQEQVFNAVFHSVSAFCNAGFSLFHASLAPYQTHAPTVMVIALLIIGGGLGFPVLFNIVQRFKSKQAHVIKLQTRLALMVTLGLLVGGTALIFMVERQQALAHLTVWQQLYHAFFQAVTTRTAGFELIPMTLFDPSTVMICMVLMIIGASPGSTGGGIKTTTFGLILISFWHMLTSRFRFDYHKKTIDLQSVLMAFSTLFLALILIVGIVFVLLQVEQEPLSALLFEVISAFGTVGLSMGITPHLTPVGKVILMVVMFIGRMGPFVFLYTFFRTRSSLPYAYPVEKVSII